VFLEGTGTNLKQGDVLVLSDAEAAIARRVASVQLDRERNHTAIDFESTAASAVPMNVRPGAPSAASASSLPGGSRPTVESVAGLFLKSTVSTRELYALGYFHGWDLGALQIYLNKLPETALSTADSGVFAMRTRVGFFGHNAPKWKSLPLTKVVTTTINGNVSSTAVNYENDVYPVSWDANQRTIWEDSQGTDHTGFDVFLERALPEVVRNGWVVLEVAGKDLLPLRVGLASEVSRADYALSAKCTGLQLQNVDGAPITSKDAAFKNRDTTAQVQSEALTVIGAPIETPLQQGDAQLSLDRIDKDLFVGQALAMNGENADLPGTTVREVIVIAGIVHGDVTILTLREGLKQSYVRATVTLCGNVVPATHGETTQEVLGSGDAATPFQRFTLKQKPLTYAFPPGASQVESSLEIRVDDVRWREAATFFDCGPDDRVYIVRRADDGTTSVQFGDGRHGARLPTGRENVKATYRKGIGLEGLADPDQISLMVTQPLGVKGVSNLLAPEGAEDPQSLADARVNTPRAVLALDRVVSLQDYEDFARDFPGVDKAHAAWVWRSQARGVFLTLLGPGGRAVAEMGQPAEPLRLALSRQGNARVPVKIASRPPSLFALTGIVYVDPDRLPSVVEAAIRQALLATFSFEAREFGRGVHLSEVLAAIQNVPGVAFIDAMGFEKTSKVDGASATENAVNGYLPAHRPANGADILLAEPAELLIFDETSLSRLEVRTQ